jgi:Resolvase, N terminal domain
MCGLMKHNVPFIVAEFGVDTDPFMLRLAARSACARLSSAAPSPPERRRYRFAQTEGFEILELFVEVESGKHDADKRPVLAKALTRAKRDRAPILVAKLDRLSRDVHYISAKARGVSLGGRREQSDLNRPGSKRARQRAA